MDHPRTPLTSTPAPTSTNPEPQPPKRPRPGVAYWAASTICVAAAGLCLYWRAAEGHTLRGFIALVIAITAGAVVFREVTS